MTDDTAKAMEYLIKKIPPETSSKELGVPPPDYAKAFITQGILGLSIMRYTDKEILDACQEAITWCKDR